MLRRISRCLALPVFLTAIIFPLAAPAQSQDVQSQSVAEAARRAREQKKKSEKPVRVITEDTLNPAAAAPQAGAAPAGETVPAEPGPSEAAAQPAADTGNAPAKQEPSAETADLKKQLVELQKELDLLQAELSLQRDTYYSNPDYVHDTAGKAKVEALQRQVNDKQQEIESLKTRLAAR